MRDVFGLGLFALMCLGAAGCKPPPPPRPVAEAEGAVTYDGEPVPSGIVSFIPAEADGRPTAGGPVIKGRYRIDPDAGLTTGKYRVEIRWGKPTGEKIKDAGYGQSPDVIAEGLPEKYNKDSVLTADVQAGPNTIDFRLDK